MKVGFFHLGFPSPDDGSARSWRNLAWLAKRHETWLVPVNAGAGREQAAGVRVADPVALRMLAGRLTPGRVRFSSESTAAIEDRFEAFDWIWLAWWPLATLDRQISSARRRNKIVTWDWDALSVASFTAFRPNVARSPARAVARVVQGVSLRRFEVQKLGPVTGVSTPSPRDRAVLARRHPQVFLVRNCVDLDAFQRARACPAADCQPRVVFVGSGYEPNNHGIGWFLRRVWPATVERVPDAELILVGRELHISAGLQPSVHHEGAVLDIAAFLGNARVAISPIFYGAGIPFKLLEYGAAARPAVVTQHCARALGSAEGFTVAHGAREWVRELTQLLTSTQAAQLAGLRTFERVRRDFAIARWEADLSEMEGRLTSL